MLFLFWVLIIGGGCSWELSLGRAWGADDWSTIMLERGAGTASTVTVMGETNRDVWEVALFLTSLVGLLWTATPSKLEPDSDRRREERVAASLVEECAFDATALSLLA